MLMITLMVSLWLAAAGFPPAHAADMELQAVDKGCWIEVFDDDKYDPDDPHVKIQGPQDFATLKNVAGRDWANDIESVIVGPNAHVKAYKEKDYQGTEIAFAPNQRIPDLAKLKMGNDIESMKITCGP